MSIAYYNGKISSVEKVMISPSDRGVYFGDGVYDAALGRGGKIYLLSEHIERLIKNAKALGIPCPYDSSELEELLLGLYHESGEDVAFIYFQLTRCADARVHSASGITKSNLYVTVTPCAMPNPASRVRLVSYPDKRYLYCNVKTLNLLPSVLAATYADSRGCDEAVFVRDGYVTECAHSNISIIKDGILYTHPECEKILSGITRKTLLKAAFDMGITVREKPFTVGELYAADEVIITSSTKLARLAHSVDGIRYDAKSGSIGEILTKKVHFFFVNCT